MQNLAIIQTLVQSLFSENLISAWQDTLKQQVGSLISSTKRNNIMGEALSGQTRADAAMLRQASKNVGEAESMMSLAADSAKNIQGMLGEAGKIAAAYQASSDASEKARLQAQYDSIKSNIDNVVKNTSYNGIALMDGAKWGKDERVTADAAAGAGKVQIYAGRSGFDLTMSDARKSIVDPMGALSLDADDAVDTLSKLEGSAKLMGDVYTQRSTSLGGQVKSLERQAGILDDVAANQINTGQTQSVQDMLLNLALSDKGKIISGKG